MQDDLAGLIAELHEAAESYADCGKSSLAVRLQRAATALETLTRERDEARAEVETQGDEVVRLRIELADAAFDRDKATAQLTATRARLGEAVGLMKAVSRWRGFPKKASEAWIKITAFLAQQEGQSNG